MTAILSLLAGCGLLQERQAEGPTVHDAITEPLSPEETEGLMGEVANNWFYGNGLGETAVTAGTILVFPPYALYVVGNAALSVTGYEEIRITDALPDDSRDAWDGVYDSVTSVPGNVTAAVSGEEFRNRAEAKEALQRYLQRRPAAAPNQNQE